jgi:hypothetical protein
VTASGEGQGPMGTGGDAAAVPRPIGVGPEMAAAAVWLRFTWDASDPGVIAWRNEMAVGDGSWFLIEEYPMVPQ